MKIETKLVGVTFEPAKTNFKKLIKGQVVDLQHYHFKQEGCQEDPFAVKVLNNGEMCGHIGSPLNKFFVEAGIKKAVVSEVLYLDEDVGFNDVRFGDVVSVKIKAEVKENETKKIKSLTEDEYFEFDEVKHKYCWLGNKKKKFISASQFHKPYVKPFDLDEVAQRCAKYWDIPVMDIKKAWAGNQSANLGTVLHKVLEDYFNQKELGINTKTDKSYFMPKLPFLVDFIEGFEDLVKDIKCERTIQEPLLSDVKKGYVGFADRIMVIDEKKKICRIGDYKINHGITKKGQVQFIKPYTDLETTKLSKIRFQMEFLARLMEHGGWTVQGLDVFCFDGKWSHYEVDRLLLVNY